MLMRTLLLGLVVAALTPNPVAFSDDLDIAFDDLAATAMSDIADLKADGSRSPRARRQLRALRRTVRLIGRKRDSLRREGRIALGVAAVLTASGLAEMDGDSEYSSLVDDILDEYDTAIYDALERADTAASYFTEEGAYEVTEQAIESVDGVLDRAFDEEKLVPYARIYARAGARTDQVIAAVAKTAARQSSTLTWLIDGEPVSADTLHAVWTTDAAGNTRLTGGGSALDSAATVADVSVAFGTEENMEEEDYFDIDPESEPNGAFASLQVSAAASSDGVAHDFTATYGELDIAFLGLEFGIVEGEFEFTGTEGDPDDPDAEVEVTEGRFVIFGVQSVDERSRSLSK